MAQEKQVNKPHHWSGWPGAYCLHCGAEDPMELAIAIGDFDPWNGDWISQEAKIQYQKDCLCPIECPETCPQYGDKTPTKGKL